MTASSILLTVDENIAFLTLNRAERHNAFDDQLIERWLTLLDEIEKNETIRVVIIAANGKSFSAGADLAWMQRMIHYSHDENMSDALKLAQLLQKLRSLRKPTIALVQGPAYGGGVGIIACCDIAIATPETRFCFSEVKLGLIPAVISPFVIAAIGVRNTQRYFLTAEMFDAVVAHQLGLIHQLVPLEQLKETGLQMAYQILKNGPHALHLTKDLLHYVQDHPITENLLHYLAEKIARTRISEEGQAGIKAFLEKQLPYWVVPYEN